MTKVKAKFKSVRISPRKLSRVAAIIRGKFVLEAIALLRFMPQKGAKVLAELIKSAKANATHNYKLNEQSLKIESIFVNQGFIMKRWQARAKGRVGSIYKRSSHVTIWVKEDA
ncbi:MAG: 50S ribosomal protein L22 [bacterium]|nr:50S ribosomal protein L22 [Candidatus Margulisiibacteriota bacterium]